MKKYELPLTRDYCRNWTAVEAIREIIQNALDFNDGMLDAFVDEGEIIIRSIGARLEPKTLLLGCTTKADDDQAIGSFGEGYKIALLVLARENIDVEVYNCGVKWKPAFEMSKSFGEEVLVINETWAENSFANQSVIFTIRGLSEEVTAKVKDNTLQLQENIGSFHRVDQGDILLEKSGKLYVNGLFVANTGMEFGYNVRPAYLKLERDRQTVSDFDLKFLTKDMWFGVHLPNKVAELMEKGVLDLEYAQYGTPDLVKEACYKAFTAKHPGAVVAASRHELERLVKEGMTEVHIYPASYSSTIQGHESYKENLPKTSKMTPQATLRQFFADNSSGMDRKCKEHFRALMNASAVWK